MSKITKTIVAHVAHLAQIPITVQEEEKLVADFETTLAVVDELKSVDVSKTEPTHLVTGLENILREDIVRPEYMLTQAEALANATRQHDGYFVVPQVIDQDNRL